MTSSFETLPVELLHRIFNNLDARTIIFSIRPVCRLFQSIVNSHKIYNQYIVDMKLISKSNIYILCKWIIPENVISLILSNDYRTSNQITLFISLVNLRQFSRLHSLTLLNIDEHELIIILKQIKFDLLTSFTFNIRNYDDKYTKTTNNLLTSIISQLTLSRLELGINSERISKILWPINCTIQYLVINNGITIDNLYTILQYCSRLQILHIKQSFKKILNNNILKNSFTMYFPQLTSLIIENLDVLIDEFELFLLLLPSLIYLKLIGGPLILDGKRWEEFIKKNLFQLNKFEFYFYEWKTTKQTRKDLELIIHSFQTPFWIEDKKWFVTCECSRIYSYSIYIYSLPICKSSLKYEIDSQKISISTKNNDQLMTTNNINSLYFILEETLGNDIQEKTITTNYFLFPKVTEIDLQFRQDCPLYSLQSLSIFIDISKIIHMKISCNCLNEYKWKDIGRFISQAKILSSLIIQNNFHKYQLDETDAQIIYSILPYDLKNLQIPIHNLIQIQMILERCQHLSTITFNNQDKRFFETIKNWFAVNTIDTTFHNDCSKVYIWIGRKKIQSTKTNFGYKRLKTDS